jgi:hypothetical protein
MTPEEAAVHRFSVGDRVSQSQYGAGTVTAVDERHTIIVFDEHGSRTFVTAIVKLEASDTEKPVKAKRTRKTAAKASS